MEERKVNVDMICATEIDPTEVRWLWYPYIPYGKITLLHGDPGDGKSLIAMDLAAKLTAGKPLPFQEEEREPIRVIYQNTEDDASDTVIPRFMNAGGKRENLWFIDEKEKALTFEDERIGKAIRQVDAKVLIFDPLVSYIGGDVSMNNANEVRSRFNPLIEVAKETGCAVIITGHINKKEGQKALYRSNGSIDVVSSARSALVLGRSDTEPNQRILAMQKSNLAAFGPSMVFAIEDGGIVWLEQIEKTADEVLSSVYSPGGGASDSKKQRAMDFLRGFLKGDPQISSACYDRLNAIGISRRTAESAKSELGIKSVNQNGVWFWSLTS